MKKATDTQPLHHADSSKTRYVGDGAYRRFLVKENSKVDKALQKSHFSFFLQVLFATVWAKVLEKRTIPQTSIFM